MEQALEQGFCWFLFQGNPLHIKDLGAVGTKEQEFSHRGYIYTSRYGSETTPITRSCHAHAHARQREDIPYSACASHVYILSEILVPFVPVAGNPCRVNKLAWNKNSTKFCSSLFHLFHRCPTGTVDWANKKRRQVMPAPGWVGCCRSAMLLFRIFRSSVR